jgi:hypothetical protein
MVRLVHVTPSGEVEQTFVPTATVKALPEVTDDESRTMVPAAYPWSVVVVAVTVVPVRESCESVLGVGGMPS